MGLAFYIIVLFIVIRIVILQSRMSGKKKHSNNALFRSYDLKDQIEQQLLYVQAKKKQKQATKQPVQSNKKRMASKRKDHVVNQSDESEIPVQIDSSLTLLEREVKTLHVVELNELSLLDRQFLRNLKSKAFDWSTISRQEVTKLKYILEKNQLKNTRLYVILLELEDTLYPRAKNKMRLDSLKVNESTIGDELQMDSLQVENLKQNKANVLDGFSAKKALVWKEMLDKPKSLR